MRPVWVSVVRPVCVSVVRPVYVSVVRPVCVSVMRPIYVSVVRPVCVRVVRPVCVSVVRRVLEYAYPVWHTNLQNYLSDNIEMIQKRALKCFFPDKSYADILNDLGLHTLKERQDCLCKRYFNKMKVSSLKVNNLLPDKRFI